MMTSHVRRLARNTLRSAGDPTPDERWFFVVEPSAPTTKVAIVLIYFLSQVYGKEIPAACTKKSISGALKR